MFASAPCATFFTVAAGPLGSAVALGASVGAIPLLGAGATAFNVVFHPDDVRNLASHAAAGEVIMHRTVDVHTDLVGIGVVVPRGVAVCIFSKLRIRGDAVEGEINKLILFWELIHQGGEQTRCAGDASLAVIFHHEGEKLTRIHRIGGGVHSLEKLHLRRAGDLTGVLACIGVAHRRPPDS